MKNGVIFSDESGQDANHRYGVICTISGLRKNLLDLHFELQELLKKTKSSEFKFKKVKGVDSLSLAKDMVDVGIKYINLRKIWLHIIVWDKKDSRHKVIGRNDDANLCRMYYHLIKNLHRDWKQIDNWSFYPDEYSAINWENDLVQYLRKTSFYQTKDLFEEIRDKKFPNYLKVEEKKSEMMNIIQLSDLFAGVVRTSRDNSEKFQLYLEETSQQLNLFPPEKEIKISKNLRPKLELLKYFKNKTSENKLGVNFSENKYFKTFNKGNNINIWHYLPQSELDKAPVKKTII